MRLAIFGGIGILIAFTIFWQINLSIDLFQCRAAKEGYTRFHQLINSLFNELQNQEADEIDNLYATFIHNMDTNNVQQIICNSWSLLSELIGVNHDRVLNASKIVRNNPTILYDHLHRDLQIADQIVNSYKKRLTLAFNKFPPFLLLHRNRLDNILATVNDINHEFQYFVGYAIERIDFDQFESHKLSSVRMAKILQQFENIIQLQNESHLGCACDVAKLLNEIIWNFIESVHLCVSATGQELSDYIKETMLPVSHSMESTIRSVDRAIKTSSTSIDTLYHLPLKVRLIAFF